MIIYLQREEESFLIKMIYTYLFTDKFFNDWRSNINTEQSQIIYDFFKEKFQNKENIFYCGKEEVLNKVHGVSGPNSNLIDFFLTEFISNGCKSIFSDREKIVFERYATLHRQNKHKMIPIPVCEIPKAYL